MSSTDLGTTIVTLLARRANSTCPKERNNITRKLDRLAKANLNGAIPAANGVVTEPVKPEPKPKQWSKLSDDAGDKPATDGQFNRINTKCLAALPNGKPMTRKAFDKRFPTIASASAFYRANA